MKKKQERIEQIRKQIHPHDDEPDPTAYMGNYNFPQMLFAFCLGFVTMFVLFQNELNEFNFDSACPLYPSISKMTHVQLTINGSNKNNMIVGLDMSCKLHGQIGLAGVAESSYASSLCSDA